MIIVVYTINLFNFVEQTDMLLTYEKMKNISFIIVLLLAPTFPLKITINPNSVKGHLTKFWKSTGFSPSSFDQTSTREFLMSKDVEHNLAIISALPNQGIEFVRIHWLLNLLYFKSDGTINWELLDEVIDLIVGNDMKPVIELMVNPETDQKKELFKSGGRYFWKWITSALAQRYVDKYGSKMVSEWRFETWNEPDLKMYNVLNFGLEEYIDYVMGCAEGIKSVLPEVDFGGPAGLFKNISNHPLCWGFLNYCNNDLRRCKLNYISLHKKGNSSTSEILNGMNSFRVEMNRKYPNLGILPLINDETDLLSGWWRDEDWRGDIRYAAAVCRTIFLYRSLLHSLNVKSISNDNGFLNTPPNFFNQRTLLTRFSDTEGNAHFVQKPVYAAMGLLSMLGEEEVQTIYKEDDRFSIIATRNNHYNNDNKMTYVCVMIVHSSDTMEINDTKHELELITNLPTWENARYVLYKLENIQPNPKDIWKKLGSPMIPTLNQLSVMRRYQEPKRIAIGKVKKIPFSIKYSVVQPSISFLQICDSSVGKPGKKN
ncbi:unnamed protein product [Nezara viridula]|uniref:Glycosyl hydrolases family 39 N-terminal catalytic domain-containing protein n=1 Tax=Nezara viridula TaxID=85310 RepID=A0A9P0H3J6_NEZVI|nr:unnamed protein product [Nezara viridula]